MRHAPTWLGALVGVLMAIPVCSAALGKEGDESSVSPSHTEICAISISALAPDDTWQLNELWTAASRLQCRSAGVDPDALLEKILRDQFVWAPNGVSAEFIKHYFVVSLDIPIVALVYRPSAEHVAHRLSLARQALQLGPLDCPPTLSPSQFLRDLMGRSVLIEVQAKSNGHPLDHTSVPAELADLVVPGSGVYLLLRDVTKGDI